MILERNPYQICMHGSPVKHKQTMVLTFSTTFRDKNNKDVRKQIHKSTHNYNYNKNRQNNQSQ